RSAMPGTAHESMAHRRDATKVAASGRIVASLRDANVFGTIPGIALRDDAGPIDGLPKWHPCRDALPKNDHVAVHPSPCKETCFTPAGIYPSAFILPPSSF